MTESKKLILVLCLLLLAIGGCRQKNKASSAQQTDTVPVLLCGGISGCTTTVNDAVYPTRVPAAEMLREFYTLYITENSKVSDFDAAAVKNIKNKYVTERLIMELEKAILDYDPFLNAQDCETSWIKTLEIHPDTTLENTWEVSYAYDALHRSCMSLSLVHIDGEYLIDDVDGLSDAAEDETEFTSPIRPGERLLSGEIFTDRFEYTGYNADGDYYLLLVDKNGKTFRLIDGCPEGMTSVLHRGDSVEVRWKIDSIWVAGDGRQEMAEWAVNVNKIKEGKVSLFRNMLSKPVELRYDKTDETMDLSESYLSDLRDSVEYYMADFMQEEVQKVLDDDPSVTFYCTVNKHKQDGEPYYFILIYGEFENKRRLPWICPQSLLLNNGTLRVFENEVWDNPSYEDDSE